jgi:hypothetical protein
MLAGEDVLRNCRNIMSALRKMARPAVIIKDRRTPVPATPASVCAVLGICEQELLFDMIASNCLM